MATTASSDRSRTKDKEGDSTSTQPSVQPPNRGQQSGQKDAQLDESSLLSSSSRGRSAEHSASEYGTDHSTLSASSQDRSVRRGTSDYRTEPSNISASRRERSVQQGVSDNRTDSPTVSSSSRGKSTQESFGPTTEPPARRRRSLHRGTATPVTQSSTTPPQTRSTQRDISESAAGTPPASRSGRRQTIQQGAPKPSPELPGVPEPGRRSSTQQGTPETTAESGSVLLQRRRERDQRDTGASSTGTPAVPQGVRKGSTASTETSLAHPSVLDSGDVLRSSRRTSVQQDGPPTEARSPLGDGLGAPVDIGRAVGDGSTGQSPVRHLSIKTDTAQAKSPEHSRPTWDEGMPALSGIRSVPPVSSTKKRKEVASTPGSPESVRPGSSSPRELSPLPEDLYGMVVGQQDATSRWESCFIASLVLLLIIIICIVILLYLFNTKIVEEDDVVYRRPELRQFYCDAPVCKRFSRDIVGYIKWTSNPCLDLFRFVCGGFLEEASNELYGAVTPNDMYSRVDRHLEEKYYRDKFVSYDILRRPVRNMAEVMESSLGDCLLSNDSHVPRLREFGMASDTLSGINDALTFREIRAVFTRLFALFPAVHITISMFPKNVDGTKERRFHMFPLAPIAPRMMFDSETFREDFLKDISDVLVEVASITATHAVLNEVYEVLRELHMGMPHRKVDLPTYRNISIKKAGIGGVNYEAVMKHFFRNNITRNENMVLHHRTYLGTIRRITGKYGSRAFWNAMMAYGCLQRGVRYRKPASKQLYVRIRRGIYGPVTDKRTCIEAMGGYLVGFQYDLMREYMHKDDLAKYLKKEPLTQLFRNLALEMLHQMNIFTAAERTIAENKVKNLAVYFFYPDAHLTKKEAGKYPFTSQYMTTSYEDLSGTWQK